MGEEPRGDGSPSSGRLPLLCAWRMPRPLPPPLLPLRSDLRAQGREGSSLAQLQDPETGSLVTHHLGRGNAVRQRCQLN